MTFAELILFIVFAIALYFCLRPLQLRLEKNFLKFLRKTSPQNRKEREVIDMDDYMKGKK